MIHPYACAHCQESFPVSTSLVSHFKNNHVSVKYCDVKNEDTNIDIEGNMSNSPEDEGIIYKKDRTGTNITNHQNIKAVEKEPKNNFSCTKCDKSYSVKYSLYKHLFTHEEKKHSCEFCDKKFMYLQTLKLHKRKHTGEKPYACCICDKKFTLKHNREKHEKNQHR